MKKLMLLLVVFLMAVPLAQAQDSELTAEQQALLDRALAAVQASDDYTSYVSTNIETRSDVLELSGAGIEQTQERTSTVEEQVSYIKGDDGKNISSLYKLSVTESTGAETVAYTIEGEIRFVDGILYVRGEAVEGEPELPEGWVTSEEALAYSAFDRLSLDDKLEDALDEGFNLLMNAAEEAKLVATDVTSEETTLEDGTAVEMISFSIPGAAIGELMKLDPSFDPADPSNMLLDMLGEDSFYAISLYLDENDVLVGVNISGLLTATEVNMNELDPNSFPAGLMLNFNSENVEETFLQQVNETLEPVEAPELQ